MKYYISNNIHFIRGFGDLMSAPCQASRFTHNDGKQFISSHPDHVLMKYGNAKRQRSYVISTPQIFVGNNCVVNNMRSAKSFSTPQDAFLYIKSHQDLAATMGCDMVFVIDENYKKIKDPSVASAVSMNHTVNVSGAVSSVAATPKRIAFSPGMRRKVYAKSNLCGICGKPVDESVFTIDHIVPLSRGGTNDLDNLRATHPSCNELKGRLTDDEMMKIVSDVSINSLRNMPNSEMGAQCIRAIVRGTISKYSSVWKGSAS